MSDDEVLVWNGMVEPRAEAEPAPDRDEAAGDDAEHGKERDERARPP